MSGIGRGTPKRRAGSHLAKILAAMAASVIAASCVQTTVESTLTTTTPATPQTTTTATTTVPSTTSAPAGDLAAMWVRNQVDPLATTYFSFWSSVNSKMFSALTTGNFGPVAYDCETVRDAFVERSRAIDPAPDEILDALREDLRDRIRQVFDACADLTVVQDIEYLNSLGGQVQAIFNRIEERAEELAAG